MERDDFTISNRRRRSANPSETTPVTGQHPQVKYNIIPATLECENAEEDLTEEGPATTRTKLRTQNAKLKDDNAFLLTVITVMCAVLSGFVTRDVWQNPQNYEEYIKVLVSFAAVILSGRLSYLYHKDNTNDRRV